MFLEATRFQFTLFSLFTTPTFLLLDLFILRIEKKRGAKHIVSYLKLACVHFPLKFPLSIPVNVPATSSFTIFNTEFLTHMSIDNGGVLTQITSLSCFKLTSFRKELSKVTAPKRVQTQQMLQLVYLSKY